MRVYGQKIEISVSFPLLKSTGIIKKTLKSHFDPCKDWETLSIKTRKWKCTTPGFTNKCLCTFQRTPSWMYNIDPGYPGSDVSHKRNTKNSFVKYDRKWLQVLMYMQTPSPSFFFSFCCCCCCCCLNIYINKLRPRLNLCDVPYNNETAASRLELSVVELWVLKQAVMCTQQSTECADFKVRGHPISLCH